MKERLVEVNPHIDEEIEEFARCLRVSELVGLDCIENYFPHRVAMQFGMDQDLPGCVAPCSKELEIAWNNYSRPISDATLYIPSRLSTGGVTTLYLEWWKQSMFGQWVEARVSSKHVAVRQKRMKKLDQCHGEAPPAPKGNDGDLLLDFSPKLKAGDSVNVVVKDKTTPSKVLQASTGKKGGNDAGVPPGFNTVGVGNSINEDKSAGEWSDIVWHE